MIKREYLKILYLIPLSVFVFAIVHPLYYYLAYPNIVKATVVDVKEVLIDNPDYRMTDEIAEYEYELNGKVYRQTFGNHVYSHDKIIGAQKDLRVHKTNPEKIYYRNVIRPLDVIFLIFAIIYAGHLFFMFRIMKKDDEKVNENE